MMKLWQQILSATDGTTKSFEKKARDLFNMINEQKEKERKQLIHKS